MELSDRVRKKRIELGLSQEELAERMGYSSRSSINKIEMGRPVTQKIIIRLAKALDTTPSYLMGWEEEPQKITTNIIKSLRNKKNMTLEELAEEMHVNINLMAQYENGSMSIPYDLAQKLATYFDVSPNDIINVHTTASDKHILITKNKDISNAYELWSNAFHDVNFTVDEMNEIITFAKFILSKRKE